MRTRLFLAFAIASLLLLACGKNHPARLAPKGGIHVAATFPTIDAHQPTTELVVDPRTLKEKGEYLDRLEKAIDDLGVPPEAIEKPMSEDEARALTDLDKKREILREDYLSVEQATDDEWPVLKSRVEADLDDFTRSVRSASRRAGPASPRGE